MQLQSVVLYDAVELHNNHPDTFSILCSDITLSLQVGDLAKVACNGERFWARVETVIGVGEYIGRVNNNLFQNELRYGDLIALSHVNIFDVWSKSS